MQFFKQELTVERGGTYGEGVVDGLHHGGKVEVVEVVLHLDLGKTSRHGNTTLDRIGMVQPTPTHNTMKRSDRLGRQRRDRALHCLLFLGNVER